MMVSLDIFATRGWKWVKAGVSLCFLSLGTQTSAQSSRLGCIAPSADNTITTDRAAFTNASTTVPCLSLQLETGLLVSAAAGQHSVDLPEALIRIGLTNTTELHVTAPDYYQNDDTGTGFASGIGDTSIGLKQQLGPLHGTDLAIIMYVSLPSGANALSSHGYDAAVQAPWSRKLSPNWTIAGMLSTSWPTEDGRHNTTGQASLELDRQLTKPWDIFVEYSGNYPERGGPQHILHFGTAYKIGQHQQVDLHGGTGFGAYPVDDIVGAGYSVRFDLEHKQAGGGF